MSSRQIPIDIKSNFKINFKVHYQTTKSNMSNMITIYQINNVRHYPNNWVSISMTLASYSNIVH